ncbi:RNA polymerase sigma factor RpoE [Methylotenera sp.]|uniref:RNA polymerase sigma factor RpoE n=1 Tax=Methylotenera sp. TaxID=2051956 RepID=UPI00248A2AD8|nr:RNA polymerase sigma factor RpoE [Methylotenera sp.]MDI1297952.1 RNA polymerase sigma factor RpoE [Methylotenera sp.]
MMRIGNIVEFTQLNLVQSLVQPAVQGYTAQSEKSVSAKNTNEQTKSKGNLSVVAVNPTSGNREIDHELVLRAQRGDKRAFGMLVDKYQRKLARLLSRMVRDQSEIEDIVQDTFIKAYRALPNFRGDSAFYTWLYRIGINTAKNYLVSMGRRPTVSTGVEIEDAENFEDGDELRTMETPESSMMTKQIAQTVNDTVASLPEELRTAITLREIEGLSYEEIATIMNCPIGTVRSRIFRARDTISLKLKPLLDTPDNKRW